MALVVQPYDAQPMGKGPDGGPWTPDDEAQFQSYMAFDPNVRKWKSGFETKYGESPNTDNDPSYNYRKAFKAGDGPRETPSDNIYHWGSTGKASDHPTEWMNDFMQQFGKDPTQIPGGSWSPQEQEWLRQNMTTTLRAQAAIQALAPPGGK